MLYKINLFSTGLTQVILHINIVLIVPGVRNKHSAICNSVIYRVFHDFRV